MATYNLGQVAIINKGAWSSGTNYAPLNTVTHNGGSFMAISANSNVEPGVTSGWISSWVAMSRGIKSIDIVGVTTTTARAQIVLSDGSTVIGTTFSTSGVPDNSVTTAKIVNNNVTGVKLKSTGSDAVMPLNVGIKIGSSNPSAVSTPNTSAAGIAPGQIYLKYS